METKTEGTQTYIYTPEQERINERISSLLEELGQLTLDMSNAGIETAFTGCLNYQSNQGSRSANIAFGKDVTLHEAATRSMLEIENDILKFVDPVTAKLDLKALAAHDPSYIARFSYFVASMVFIARSPKLFTIYMPRLLKTAQKSGIKSLLLSSKFNEGESLPRWTMSADRSDSALGTILLTAMAENPILATALKLAVESFPDFIELLKSGDGVVKRVDQIKDDE